jgi:cytochrome P450
VSQYINHKHPDFCHETDRFDPTRFLPPNDEGRHRFAYFPFGGGPRVCIGNHFAMVEGPLVLAALAQKFDFTLVPHQQVVPDPTFTLRPKYGVQVVVRRRA